MKADYEIIREAAAEAIEAADKMHEKIGALESAIGLDNLEDAIFGIMDDIKDGAYSSPDEVVDELKDILEYDN